MKRENVPPFPGTNDDSAFNLPGLLAAWLLSQPSVSVLVRLEVLVVELLLGLVELAELLGLSFTQLFPLGVMSGEALQAQPPSPPRCFIHIAGR